MTTATEEDAKPGDPVERDAARVPESAEHFEHVLRRLVTAKNRTRPVPPSERR